MSKALSIVVPVYNGARSVPLLVDALASLEVPGGHELVLVNDGSPDDSLAVCRDLARKCPVPLTVVNLARNFGEHNAVLAGLSVARGAFVVTMDDDLQNPPGEAVRLFERCRDGGFDVVYGRYVDKRHSLLRNLGSRLVNRCADVVLDKPRGVYLSSFRCMNAFVATEIRRYAGPFPYVDGLISQVTSSIGQLDVEHRERAHGGSNYTLGRLVHLSFSMLLNHSVTPLRLGALAGGVMAVLGLAGFVQVIVEALGGGTPAGWASLMAATLLLTGVQLVVLGLTGEYVGRLFLTVNGKPQFVIRDVERNHAAGGAPGQESPS